MNGDTGAATATSTVNVQVGDTSGGTNVMALSIKSWNTASHAVPGAYGANNVSDTRYQLRW